LCGASDNTRRTGEKALKPFPQPVRTIPLFQDIRAFRQVAIVPPHGNLTPFVRPGHAATQAGQPPGAIEQ